MHFLERNVRIPIQISLNFVPRSPADSKPALIQVMAWRRTGDKPLFEPMIIQFSGSLMRHTGEKELKAYLTIHLVLVNNETFLKLRETLISVNCNMKSIGI